MHFKNIIYAMPISGRVNYGMYKVMQLTEGTTKIVKLLGEHG